MPTFSIVSDDETNAQNGLVIIFGVAKSSFGILSFKLVYLTCIGNCVKKILESNSDDFELPILVWIHI